MSKSAFTDPVMDVAVLSDDLNENDGLNGSSREWGGGRVTFEIDDV